MCGIAGYLALSDRIVPETRVLARMLDLVAHRGPDATGTCLRDRLAVGFQRLSIIDIEHSPQPIWNEDDQIILVCNGEIFNYRALREELSRQGHVFRTQGDVEVLLHLYEEHGEALFSRVNGQFAMALYDFPRRRLLLARDHAGICPLFVFQSSDALVFASEIKAILAHPLVPREVDPRGLNQILSIPALVSPLTMFRHIRTLRHGSWLRVDGCDVVEREYWDLDYPDQDAPPVGDAESYAEELLLRLRRAVELRLQADVDVGVYLSGGLDSTIVAALMRELAPGHRRHSFSVSVPQHREFCESRYQRIAATHAQVQHHDIALGAEEIARTLRRTVRHAECPLRETYNAASLALSERARDCGVPVVLCGEGSDELFAGYSGYVTDYYRAQRPGVTSSATDDDLDDLPWKSATIAYHACGGAQRATRTALYSEPMLAALREAGPAPSSINPMRLAGRHRVHQRSYLDFVIRLSGHLLADHGDRMAMANAVEARYPFLDIDLVEFVTRIPPELKFDGQTEKAILKKTAANLVPREILRRRKFPFSTPGSPALLRRNIDWIEDLLSPDRIRREGYFQPATVCRLRERYLSPDFELDVSSEEDWMLLVITFGLWLEEFKLPALN